MPQRLTELELTPSPRDRAEAMSGLADRLLDLASEHAPEDVSLPVEDFRRRVRSFRLQIQRETDPQTLCYLAADAADEVADFLDRARGLVDPAYLIGGTVDHHLSQEKSAPLWAAQLRRVLES